jgi:2-hydroxychromene-2-carboxylate isomerase
MPRLLEFWFDFASTYSYPSAQRIATLAETAGVTVVWGPFLLADLGRPGLDRLAVQSASSEGLVYVARP